MSSIAKSAQENKKLLAYHNDPAIKDKYVLRVNQHRQADRLVQGTGWSGKRGCAVGCTLENYDHALYPIELGIPVELARLEDKIFEALEWQNAESWPIRFLEAVPVGADLGLVWPKFVLWVLDGVLKYARPDGKKAIDGVIILFKRWVETGEKPAAAEFLQARKAAAYAAAAYAAAAYAAAYAAADAAYAAAYAAADAAYAAAAYAAADAAAARRNFWISAADKLIDLLKEA